MPKSMMSFEWDDYYNVTRCVTHFYYLVCGQLVLHLKAFLKPFTLLCLGTDLQMAEKKVSDTATILKKKRKVQEECMSTWPTLTASKKRCVHFEHCCVYVLCVCDVCDITSTASTQCIIGLRIC